MTLGVQVNTLKSLWHNTEKFLNGVKWYKPHLSTSNGSGDMKLQSFGTIFLE